MTYETMTKDEKIEFLEANVVALKHTNTARFNANKALREAYKETKRHMRRLFPTLQERMPLRLLEVMRDNMFRRACELLNGDMSSAEWQKEHAHWLRTYGKMYGEAPHRDDKGRRVPLVPLAAKQMEENALDDAVAEVLRSKVAL